MRNISLIIRQELERHHDTKKAKWIDNYVKLDIKSLGVGIPQIRSIVQDVHYVEKFLRVHQQFKTPEVIKNAGMYFKNWTFNF